MSIPLDAIEFEYQKYAQAFGDASERFDAKATNRNFRKLAAIRAKIKVSGKEGEGVLRRLMKDRSNAVAKCAAADSLHFAEVEALAVLDAIGKKTGAIALDAQIVAELWRSGKFRSR